MFRTLLLAAVCCWLAELPLLAQTCTPDAPLEVAATRAGTGVTVSWKDGTSAVACRATRFYVEASQNGQNVREFTVPLQGQPASTQVLTVPDVPYGGLWRFAVRSFNPAGLSPQVSAYINDISEGCFRMPDPVTQLVASASGRVVTVQWLHPGSCTLTGFVIEAADSTGRVVYTSEAFQNPAMRSFSATAPPGTWYVRVYAESHRRLTAPSPFVQVVVQ